jgi:hypothetical protein
MFSTAVFFILNWSNVYQTFRSPILLVYKHSAIHHTLFLIYGMTSHTSFVGLLEELKLLMFKHEDRHAHLSTSCSKTKPQRGKSKRQNKAVCNTLLTVEAP